jgi:hypothetical protein
MAAVFAGGAGAALSHRSAGALWGIHPDSRSRIDVTAPRARRGRREIQFHRGRLARDEVTVERGIPVTTVARTVIDLAGVVGRRQVERALNEAEVVRLAESLSLGDLLARHPGRKGTRAVREILAAGRIGQGLRRSELEHRFLAFVEAAGLPRPEVNVWLEPAPGRSIEADCVWRAKRLVVELDGHATHATRIAYERDRERDRMMQAAGWRVVRVTWRQLHGSPRAVAADLRALMER